MVQIFTVNNNVYINIAGREPNFTSILDMLRPKSIYDDSTHFWKLKFSVYPEFDSFVESLSEISRVSVDSKVQEAIDNGIHFPIEKSINVKWQDLKVKPLLGKHPNENFQLEDINKLVNYDYHGLFLEQGTGKSYITISALDYLRKFQGLSKVLFITSNSGVYNIKKELERFSDFDMSRVVIGGVKNRTPFQPSVDVVICNYRSFLLISDEYYYLSHPEVKLERQGDIEKSKLDYRKCPIPLTSWMGNSGALVLDESHFVSNPKARVTKTVTLASEYFKYRYEASGTPADKEQKYYSQLRILDKSLVHNLNYFQWLAEYADLGSKWSRYSINFFKPEKLSKLQNIINGVSTRRFLMEVLDLPENQISPYYVPFNELQKEIYQGIVKLGISSIQEKSGGSLTPTEFINAFPYLMLAIDNPELLLVHEEKFRDADPNPMVAMLKDYLNDTLISKIRNFKFEMHPKIEALIDLIEKYPDSKIVIWTSHPSVGFKLGEILKKYDPLVINGQSEIPKGMSLDEFKGQIVEEFQTSKDRRILIAGLQVMNTAVTITEANVQIIFDANFSYTEYSQAIQRIHRNGQTKKVYTYMLVIDESLDVVRRRNLLDKEFLNRNFLTKKYLTLKETQSLVSMKGE